MVAKFNRVRAIHDAIGLEINPKNCAIFSRKVMASVDRWHENLCYTFYYSYC